MKVYLAGRYSRKPEFLRFMDIIQASGHEVQADWLKSNHDHTPHAECAQIDVADIKACDVLIAFSEEPRVNNSRGGRHVELGIALALGKRIIIVGPVENVFMALPEIERVDTFREVKHLLPHHHDG